MNILSSFLRPANIRWTHPFINLPMLQLNESGTNGCNVALLIGEGYSPRPFWILQFRVCVNASVTHSPVQTVHDHGQFHWNSNTKYKVNGIETTSFGIMRAHTRTHLHVGDEGHLLQRSFSSGPMAESRPLQSHCH